MDLYDHIDKVLIASLPDSLKDTLDAALKKGATPKGILSLVRSLGITRSRTTMLAIEAYLGCDQLGNPVAKAPPVKRGEGET